MQLVKQNYTDIDHSLYIATSTYLHYLLLLTKSGKKRIKEIVLIYFELIILS